MIDIGILLAAIVVLVVIGVVSEVRARRRVRRALREICEGERRYLAVRQDGDR